MHYSSFYKHPLVYLIVGFGNYLDVVRVVNVGPTYAYVVLHNLNSIYSSPILSSYYATWQPAVKSTSKHQP